MVTLKKMQENMIHLLEEFNAMVAMMKDYVANI
jgi:hypothetical protein